MKGLPDQVLAEGVRVVSGSGDSARLGGRAYQPLGNKVAADGSGELRVAPHIAVREYLHRLSDVVRHLVGAMPEPAQVPVRSGRRIE